MTKVKLPFNEDEANIASPNLSRGQMSSALIGAVQTIRTLNNLLVTEHRHGDGFTPEMADAIHELFEQQSRVIAAVTNRLSEWEAEHRAEVQAEQAERNGVANSIRKVREAFIKVTAEAGTEAQVIAQALNIKRSSVERVIGQLRGGASAAPEASRTMSA